MKTRHALALALLAACGSPRASTNNGVTNGTATTGTVGTTPTGTVVTPNPPNPPDPPDPPPPPAKFAFPALQTSVPSYGLEVSQASLDAMAADPYAETTYPATFIADGQRYDVQVRWRGSSSRMWPKKSWRVEFPDGVKFDARHKVDFLAEYQDTTLMAEKLAFDMLAAMGAPGSRGKYATLTVNGAYQGVFVDLERVDKSFLANHHFDDKEANIYRCGNKDCEMKLFRQSYQHDFEKKTNEDQPWDDLRTFIEKLNHTPEPDFPAFLEKNMDVERQVKEMTMEALASNDIVTDSGSYLVHDRLTDKWTYVPWDLNNADSTFWPTYPLDMQPVAGHPIAIYSLTDGWIANLYKRRMNDAPDYLPAFSNLNTRIVMNPQLREKYLQMLERALDELFVPEVMNARIEAMHALIDPLMADDPYVDHAKFEYGPDFLKAYVVKRRDVLQKEIARLRGMKPGLVLEAVDAQQGWIELANRTEGAVSLSGLVVTTNLRVAMTPNLPDVTLAAGETRRFTAGELGLTLAANGEIGLFNGKSVAGMIDLLFYGELPAGKHYARSTADAAKWEVR